MENNEHKRRVRYKGTHPKSYKDKYKELQPQKYPEIIDKVIQKGSTPAGMHLSICVKEILEVLAIQPTDIGLDATLGYGGHTKEMLRFIGEGGHLYALDVDSIEIKKTTERLRSLGFNENVLTIKKLNFADIDQVLPKDKKFDFVLADLGVSSMQIDNPARGFSYKTEGPLDLRLDPLKGIPASERLKELSLDEIEGMLQENSDEPYAFEIATAIREYLNNHKTIETTTELRKIIEDCLHFLKDKDKIKKSCQRTFQAIRIDINQEFEVLYQFLDKLPTVLAKNARVAILTFHSGEDRLVKKMFKMHHKTGLYKDIARDVIRPSLEECKINSRASSTKMRWAIKA